MLMLFIAPVISKSLAQHHVGDSMMMMHQGMDMSADEHALMATDPGVNHSERPASPVMDDSACGYCLLLVHLPLALSPLPLLWSSLQAAEVADVPLCLRPVTRFTPVFFHPRAPPPAG